VLHAYGYGEEHGGKGEKNVASLLMKHLDDRGLLDGTKRKTLNVVMDNCAGQNKNNNVLRLAPYLVKKGYFKEVSFLFFNIGHTKNVANRLTMGMMVEAMKHDLTITYVVGWQVFKHWDKFLNWLYKGKMSSVKKWHIFHSSTDLGLTKMSFKSSNADGAETDDEGLKKYGITDKERKSILLEQQIPLYANQPGLWEIKQVELWSKYCPLVPKEYQDECCPMPCKEVIEREKNKKKAKGKLKQDDEKKERGKPKVAPPVPIVASTAASTSDYPQGLTTSDTTEPLSPSKQLIVRWR
jgi:hypothetical protein